MIWMSKPSQDLPPGGCSRREASSQPSTNYTFHAEKKMVYVKPQVLILGDAKIVIEHVGIKPRTSAMDPHPHRGFFNPAYDLDE
jgi:hypothetical protein